MTRRTEGEAEGKKKRHAVVQTLSTAKVALVPDEYAKEATQLYMAFPRCVDVPAAA